ncbi:YqjD family protein [Pseudooceanicola sp.]|uniref:YqjD family protein n=1 Tax=Pseudooceanicola sp. TaxID=1914328 RepID=UPI0035C66B08
MARADSVKDAVKTEDLQADVEQLKKDIAALTKSLGEYSKAQRSHLRDVTKDAVDDAARKGREQVAAARDGVEEAYAQAEEQVRAHPSAAVGLAAGLGFVLGLVTARR